MVQRIFELCASGMGGKAIAKILNGEGVLTPSNYRAKVMKAGKRQPENRWHPETVISILRNRIYLGDMVQGVYECSRFRRLPHKRKPEDEWIITPNTHEPIVTREIFEQVQTLINSRKRITKSKELQLFAGILKCENCGSAMSYAYCQGIEQYTCGKYRRHGKEACSCHYIRKDMLEQAVLDDIRRYARLAQEDIGELARGISAQSDDAEGKKLQVLENELNATTARCVELDRIIEKLFEESAVGGISKERFRKLSAKYEQEQIDLEKQIEHIQNQLDEGKRNEQDSSSWLESIKDYADIRELDRIVLSELLEKITVGESRMVDDRKVIDIAIYYRFVGNIGEMSKQNENPLVSEFYAG